jgi:ADP-ribose pyrophosphatase YjhB (NUDIX family)
MVLQGATGEKPTWTVPGGSIGPGETPVQAAVRDVKEKTGISVRILRPYTVFKGTTAKRHVRIFYLEAHIIAGKMQAADPDSLIYQVE